MKFFAFDDLELFLCIFENYLDIEIVIILYL